MAEKESGETKWLAVIGKALSYLCLEQHRAREPSKFQSKGQQAKFLEGLGLSRTEAANALGTTAASITVLHSRAKKKKGGKSGRTKKKTR
jgi:hypothetical protein